MTAPDILALLDADAERAGKVGALAGAATEGPWNPDHYGASIDRVFAESVGLVIARHTSAADAEFIAASRTETPWLVETLRTRDAAIQAFLGRLDEADRWKPYESRDTGPVYLSETVDDLIADLRAALASALGGGEQQ